MPLKKVIIKTTAPPVDLNARKLDIKLPKMPYDSKFGILSPVSPERKHKFEDQEYDIRDVKLKESPVSREPELSNKSLESKKESELKQRAFDLLERSIRENAHFRSTFVLNKILGWGGLGVVVQATNFRSKQLVAIKIIKKKTKSPAELILKDLRHKGIIKFYDSFSDSHAVYLVLERFGKCWDKESATKLEKFRVNGKNYQITIPIQTNTSSTLFEYIESSVNNRVPAKSVKPLFYQIASAVNYLHGLGIVHADLKEENILIDIRDGRLVSKLCDFGHCFKYDGTPRMKIYGTRVLTSPELLGHLIYSDCEDEYVTGFPQDIWAVGLLFYTMIYGQLPPENDELIEGNIDLARFQYYPTSFEALKDEGYTI